MQHFNLKNYFSNNFCDTNERNSYFAAKKLKLKIPSGMNKSESVLLMKVEWNSCGFSASPTWHQTVGLPTNEKKVLSLNFSSRCQKSLLTLETFSSFHPLSRKINQQLFKNASSFGLGEKKAEKIVSCYESGDNFFLLVLPLSISERRAWNRRMRVFSIPIRVWSSEIFEW